MKTIKNMVMAAGLVLAFGACKDDFDKAMDEASSLTDRMCKCKDAACAEKVRDDRSAMKKKFKGALKDKKPDEDQMKRAEKLDERWRSCADKIEGAS